MLWFIVLNKGIFEFCSCAIGNVNGGTIYFSLWVKLYGYLNYMAPAARGNSWNSTREVFLIWSKTTVGGKEDRICGPG